MAAADTGRKAFASSAVNLMASLGMDGLDIDWEYPRDETEADSFVQLLSETRSALDKQAYGQKSRYELTVAAPAGSQHYNTLHLAAMDPFVDAWHLMAYDYSGPWDASTGHQANLYSDDTPATKATTDAAVEAYMSAGVPASKIILGMPLYGRAFANTDGLGKPFSPSTNGIYLYKDLPRAGAKVSVDKDIGAAWSYDPVTRELISYDTPESARVKANYVQRRGLGGMVFWEGAGDKTGAGSLIRTAADALSLTGK